MARRSAPPPAVTLHLFAAIGAPLLAAPRIKHADALLVHGRFLARLFIAMRCPPIRRAGDTQLAKKPFPALP